tara:strand:- start:1234 stop:1677 length:444 start_codon:yes stop_codon:yes gene_type:complete
MNFNKVISPSNNSDFDEYYYFRWEYLRKDLSQKLGTERDDAENISIHRMIKNNNEEIIGVGRLHKISSDIYQVRYFAVHKDYRRIGLGMYLMKDLEEIAIKDKANYIILNARENALDFYEKLNYKVIKKTNLLFGKIQHYEMKKKII